MRIIVVILLILVYGCGDGKKYHDTKTASIEGVSPKVKSILEFQEDLNKEFKDPEISPLPDRYRAKFETLDFFEPDTSYIVKAYLERTPDSKPFLLPTTTDRKSKERLFGIAHFELNGSKHQLEIYQSLDLIDQEAYVDYLFMPFLDETNGEETYGGGRYIDLRIPDGDSITIDFNKAYNPYCVYNKKYSCPLVPRQNYLETKVMAGVKDFTKN